MPIWVTVGHLCQSWDFGKKHGPENWNGDTQADTDEAEYSEPLNSAKSPLRAEAMLPPLSEGIHLPKR